MDSTKSTAPAATKITGNRGRYLRGVELANRKASEYGYSERAARVGEGEYRVPSCTRDEVRYKVNTVTGTCECEDFHRGHTCKHLCCGMILDSRRRARMAGLVECMGCSTRVRLGTAVEVVESGFTFYEGDILCRECAVRGGAL